ncbi:MAG: RIO1 family regulatory kinase/ATPase, partial [Halobacteriaceae archaeon]
MGIRQLVRGRVPWSQLEAVGRQLVHRYELESVRIEFLKANNWLSTPMVVNEQWFVKVISPQNAFVHALFTTGRNLGVFSSGTEGFFEYIDTPAEMAHQELVATKKIREIGVNAPRPVEAFEVNSLGVLVLEYLQNFKTLNEVSSDQVKLYSPEIFQALQLMHSNKLAHGDLRAENVLIVDTDIYFIDVTTVDDAEIESAKSYDIACTLGVLEPQ